MSNLKEKENNYFVKEANIVDAYLLRIIERFFSLEKLNTTRMINAIISEAILRYKSSIDYDFAGVSSFNDEEGIIHFSLMSLNIQEAFNKRTAFNKDFGTGNNNICIGNDYRLYNPRNPKSHKHSIEDVENLSQRLMGYKQLTSTFAQHRHNEIIDKIQYSGSAQFDLKKIETATFNLQQKFQELDAKLAQLQQLKIRYECLYEIKLSDINTALGGTS